jgi:reactive intermediate/imine deaminase
MNQSKKVIEHGAPSEEDLPYSTYVRAGDYVYVSGLVGFGSDGQIVAGGVGAQTHQIMADAKRILANAGCVLSDLIKTNICLPNADDFDTFNAAYAEYFSSKAPARATICAGLTINAAVEIEFIAYSPVG